VAGAAIFGLTLHVGAQVVLSAGLEETNVLDAGART